MERKSIAGSCDAISKAADSVKSVASTLVDKASNAASMHGANAEKYPIPPPKPTAQIAATANEQIHVPDAAAMPMPLIPAAPVGKKKQTPDKPAAEYQEKQSREAATKSANKLQQSRR